MDTNSKHTPASDYSLGPWGRRRSPRVALEIPIELVMEEDSHPARTVLVNRQGAQVCSPRICALGSVIGVTNLETGESVQARVVWSWVESEGENKVVRMALERTSESNDNFWGAEYERRARKLPNWSEERRRGPRLATRMPLDIEHEGGLERVETFDISDRGVGLVSEASYRPGAVLQLVQPKSTQDATFRVVWVEPMDGADDGDVCYRVGLEMIDAWPSFWSS